MSSVIPAHRDFGRKRPRPAVAEVNRVTALANIRKKIALLEHWVRLLSADSAEAKNSEAAHRSLKFRFPSSIRQFNLWERDLESNGKDGLSISFGRNANETLNKYPEQKAEASKLIQALKQAVRKKPTRMAQLERGLAAEVALREVREAAYVELRRAYKEAEKKVQSLSEELESVKRGFEARFGLMETELSRLRKEKADFSDRSKPSGAQIYRAK